MTYVKGYIIYYIWIKFESCSFINGLRDEKKIQITN